MFSDNRQLNELIENIYEAVTVPEQWDDVLRDIGTVLCADRAALLNNARFIAAANTDGSPLNEEMAAIKEEYHLSMADGDPWVDYLYKAKPPALFSLFGHEILPANKLVRTDYYNNFLKNYDIHDIAMLNIAQDQGGEYVNLVLHRNKQQKLFDQKEQALLRVLQPHLSRVIRMTQALSQQSLNAVYDGLDSDLSSGAHLIIHQGMVQFANSAAEAILQKDDGLRLRSGKLSAYSPKDNTALQAALNRAKGSKDNPAMGSEVVVERRSGASGFLLHVAPMRQRRQGRFLMFSSSYEPALLVNIIDTQRRVCPSAHFLKTQYGLTKKEIEFCQYLVDGMSVEEIADRMNLKLSTVRWHLANVLEKTEAGRQANLVSILHKAPRSMTNKQNPPHM